jgi:PAS domain S-box-containing protein
LDLRYLGNERFFDRGDLIVSKTDIKGRITYANRTFLEIADYTETEVVGKPHNVIRHPAMPRAIFELLWQTISSGRELFAYIVNKAKNDDHYWVIAYVTPSFSNGRIVGYHSTRRVPSPETIRNVIEPFYDRLNGIEASFSAKKDGTQASFKAIGDMLTEKKQSYDEFISDLTRKD